MNLAVDKMSIFAVSKRKIKTGGMMFNKTKKMFVTGFMVLLFIFSSVLVAEAVEKKYLIVIDPAHGGEESGVKINDKLGEKDVTLAIALTLQKELTQNKNFEAVLTRDSDKAVSLEDRKKDIIKIKPDIMISIHVNAGFGKSAAGFEIYYPGFKNLEKQKKQTKSSTKDVKNKYLNDSVRLAQIIQKNLDTLFPRKSRGIREANQTLLEGLSVPSLVVEIGFTTNPEEKKKLVSPNTQSDIAKALAKSIISFF
jgi:N-acetylmuramoyl-L-alanine amidase